MISVGNFLHFYNPENFYVAAIIVPLILLCSFLRINSLSAGGVSVAEMMGAVPVIGTANHLKKKQLLNIVEEMAIASGIPVPPVYLLNEDGINAFAAGNSPNDAIIAVTTGALKHLNRDQLQGVVAHEFSHIMNRDIKLNIRLIGLVYGIMVLSLFGKSLMDAARAHTLLGIIGYYVLAIFGAGLIAVGSIGHLFGNLIKAAVNRQREFLADAFAVQFTRNPTGLSGALKRIGGHQSHGAIQNIKAAEIGHSLFASNFRDKFLFLFDTHPRLETRIRRLEPSWDGEFIYSDQQQEATVPVRQEPRATTLVNTLTLVETVDQVGHLAFENLNRAREMINDVPKRVSRAAREAYGARAVIYCLLLDKDQEIRRTQLKGLWRNADPGVYNEVLYLVELMENLPTTLRIPLIEICISSLRQLSQSQLEMFENNVNSLARADGSIDIFEWSTQKIVFTALKKPERYHLNPTLYGSFSKLAEQVSLLLSLLIYVSEVPESKRVDIVEFSVNKLGCGKLKLVKKSDIDRVKLNNAVNKLNRLKPLLKPRLLKTFAHVLEQGNQEKTSGKEILRAVAEVLDCPMPVLI